MRGATISGFADRRGKDDFNPRTPCGVRQSASRIRTDEKWISIHAPHAGCDIDFQQSRPLGVHFNPRTPCGVRRKGTGNGESGNIFQSTHPMRGATYLLMDSKFPYPLFQSTHPMRGATRDIKRKGAKRKYFNPRTPCGVRRAGRRSATHRYRISIHAPHAGCDVLPPMRSLLRQTFQSTHPMRGATFFRFLTDPTIRFQSTHPMRGATE